MLEKAREAADARAEKAKQLVADLEVQLDEEKKEKAKVTKELETTTAKKNQLENHFDQMKQALQEEADRKLEEALKERERAIILKYEKREQDRARTREEAEARQERLRGAEQAERERELVSKLNAELEIKYRDKMKSDAQRFKDQIQKLETSQNDLRQTIQVLETFKRNAIEREAKYAAEQRRMIIQITKGHEALLDLRRFKTLLKYACAHPNMLYTSSSLSPSARLPLYFMLICH